MAFNQNFGFNYEYERWLREQELKEAAVQREALARQMVAPWQNTSNQYGIGSLEEQRRQLEAQLRREDQVIRAEENLVRARSGRRQRLLLLEGVG